MYGAETLKYFISCHFTGSSSSPDEQRLLKHLFDPDYQEHDLKTTPILDISEGVDVLIALELRKLIALVISKDLPNVSNSLLQFNTDGPLLLPNFTLIGSGV